MNDQAGPIVLTGPVLPYETGGFVDGFPDHRVWSVGTNPYGVPTATLLPVNAFKPEETT